MLQGQSNVSTAWHGLSSKQCPSSGRGGLADGQRQETEAHDGAEYAD